MSESLDRLRHALRRRYEVERVLGEGGMATVYLARDLRYDRHVAVKVLRSDLGHAVGAERFLREIQITARLQHPHILPLLDSGAAKGILYAVMPYVDGSTLRERLVERGPLPIGDALLVARETAEALDHAHRRGIVHRDVKPENILLSDGHAVVADFGIARAIGLAGGTSLTGVGVPIGTLAYMSPEQAAGEGEVGAASDVYSLGCVLYEMLTGQRAFPGSSVAEVAANQAIGRPAPPSSLRPEIPPAVSEVVMRSLARDPRARFATAGEMANRLRELLGEPSRVQTPSDGGSGGLRTARGARASRAGRRRRMWHRLVVGAVAAALLATAAVLFAPAASDGVAGGGAERAVAAAGAATASATPSVAVLPLDVLGGTREDAYLGEGLTGEIIAQLAQVPGLKVISRTSVVALKDARLTIPEIAETLGVRHVLEGSLQRAGDELVARVQLVDALSDATVWQHRYQVADSNLFDFQGTVAQEVARALAERVGEDDPASVMQHRAATNRPAAYQAYLRGMYWLDRRTPDGLDRAADAFAEAVALDSGYAEAYAGLATAHTMRIIYGFRTEDDPYTVLARAVVLADRAVELDSASARAWSVRTDARAHALYPDSLLRPELERTYALLARTPDGRMSTAYTLMRLGRRDSALARGRTVVALDPLSAGMRHGFLTMALQLRSPADARREAARGLRMDPRDPINQALAAYAALAGPRPQECAAHDLGPWLALRATCLHTIGRVAEGRALADSLAALLDAERYTSLHQFAELAGYYAWIGDAGRAVAWLERSAAHTPVLQRWMLESAVFDRVRDDPAFRAGLRRVEELIRTRVRAREGMVRGSEQ